ncbi:spermidine synthase [Cohnella herbarum]|nr:fused MFS/spermidine synthase [Cohnella herbarum]
MHLLTKRSSAHNEIAVYETSQLYGKMGKFRCMGFADDAVQGAIDLKDPKRIVLEYQSSLISLMEFINPYFERVFLIGHGIGTIAGHYPNKLFTIAEIDESVVDISRQYFMYERNNVKIGDGRQLLDQEEQSSFDYIIVDAFTDKGTPHHLKTLEFFALTKEKLDSNGVLLLNLMGKTNNDWLLNAVNTTIRNTYDYVKAFSLPAVAERDERNIIVLASGKTLDAQAGDVGKGIVEIQLSEGHTIMDSD